MFPKIKSMSKSMTNILCQQDMITAWKLEMVYSLLQIYPTETLIGEAGFGVHENSFYYFTRFAL